MGSEKKTGNPPRLAGISLKAVAALAETWPASNLIVTTMLEQAGIDWLREQRTDAVPAADPVLFERCEGGKPTESTDMKLVDEISASIGSGDAGPGPGRFADLAASFSTGKSNPVEVAQKLVENLEKADAMSPPLGAVTAWKEREILEQASASSQRWRNGSPRSLLEGVPVIVKEELDVKGYPTTVGTSFLGRTPAERDASCVQRLKAAGAVIVGKANMHEIGMGVTGLNPHFGPARNPYDPDRMTGGSSSGSAAAVASGLCPLAVGADGGGSIRIPSALCGIVGLKPTFGRVSEYGAAPLCWSVAHVGPMGWSVADVAVGYAVMAGPDPMDRRSMAQPRPRLTRFLAGRGLKGTRIGVPVDWFHRCSNDVRAGCEKVIRSMAEAGAVVVEIPEPVDLDLVLTSHLVTIVSEMAAAHAHLYEEHKRDYGPDTRLNLALARNLSAVDYVHAQRHRTEIYEKVMNALAGVDVLAMPSTGTTAPSLSKDALKTGESDLATTKEIMKFSPLANLTGLPAMSVPVGYDVNSLPIGLQLLGPAWSEDFLLSVASGIEELTDRKRPKVWFESA